MLQVLVPKAQLGPKEQQELGSRVRRVTKGTKVSKVK